VYKGIAALIKCDQHRVGSSGSFDALRKVHSRNGNQLHVMVMIKNRKRNNLLTIQIIVL